MRRSQRNLAIFSILAAACEIHGVDITTGSGGGEDGTSDSSATTQGATSTSSGTTDGSADSTSTESTGTDDSTGTTGEECETSSCVDLATIAQEAVVCPPIITECDELLCDALQGEAYFQVMSECLPTIGCDAEGLKYVCYTECVVALAQCAELTCTPECQPEYGDCLGTCP